MGDGSSALKRMAAKIKAHFLDFVCVHVHVCADTCVEGAYAHMCACTFGAWGRLVYHSSSAIHSLSFFFFFF